jgi:hypothetical protein
MSTNAKVLLGLVVVGIIVLVLHQNNVFNGNSVQLDANDEVVETFYNYEAPADGSTVSSVSQDESVPQEQYVDASEPLGDNEQPKGLQQTDSTQVNQLPSECYPKDVLSSADLLPRDADSLYAQVNPSGQGSLADQNFLTAGYHVGINTVGQTLRNANRQLRSEPPNPQVKVSPWQQTTIEPDINRRPLEIAGEQ